MVQMSDPDERHQAGNAPKDDQSIRCPTVFQEQLAWDPADLSYSISWRYKEPFSSASTVDGKALACPAPSNETPLQLTDSAYDEQCLIECLVHWSISQLSWRSKTGYDNVFWIPGKR